MYTFVFILTSAIPLNRYKVVGQEVQEAVNLLPPINYYPLLMFLNQC